MAYMRPEAYSQPALTITSQTQLLTHIRLHTTPRQSLNVRDPTIKEATKDQPLVEWLVDLEKTGEVLLARAIGPFAHSDLPKLGRKNGLGLGISDLEKGASRIRGVFWDEVRGRGRAGKRVDEGESRSRIGERVSEAEMGSEAEGDYGDEPLFEISP